MWRKGCHGEEGLISQWFQEKWEALRGKAGRGERSRVGKIFSSVSEKSSCDPIEKTTGRLPREVENLQPRTCCFSWKAAERQLVRNDGLQMCPLWLVKCPHRKGAWIVTVFLDMQCSLSNSLLLLGHWYWMTGTDDHFILKTTSSSTHPLSCWY